MTKKVTKKKAVKKKVPRKVGRPTRYKKEFAEQAFKLCLLGYTNDNLAEFYNVAVSTIGLWLKNKKEFSDAVMRGKDIADANVAEGFYKRAIGFRYDEVHKEDHNGKMKTSKIVTKEVVPDAGAALNWLKNRQRDKWSDNKEITLTEKSPNEMTDAELDAALEAARSRI